MLDIGIIYIYIYLCIYVFYKYIYIYIYIFTRRYGNECSAWHHLPLISLVGGRLVYASGVRELDAVAPGRAAGIHRDFAGLVEGEGLRKGVGTIGNCWEC